MAIFRCNKCGHIREVENNYTGKSVKCPKCDQVTKIRDTVAFLIYFHAGSSLLLYRFSRPTTKDTITSRPLSSKHSTAHFTRQHIFLCSKQPGY